MNAPINDTNNNWMRALLLKLSKNVSVRKQSFTEEEQAQARENLGIDGNRDLL